MSNSYLFPALPEGLCHLQRLGHIAAPSVLAMAIALAAGRCVSGQSMAHDHLEYDLVLVDIADIDQSADSDLDSAKITAGWQSFACFADITVDLDHKFATEEDAAYFAASENSFGNIVAAGGAAADARAVTAPFLDRFIAVFGFVESGNILVALERGFHYGLSRIGSPPAVPLRADSN